MEHAARHCAELSVASVLVKPKELVFGDRYSFRHYNQELYRVGKLVSTRCANKSVDVPFHNADCGDILNHPTSLPVHNLWEHLAPLALFFGVHANFGRQNRAGRAGLPVRLERGLCRRCSRSGWSS